MNRDQSLEQLIACSGEFATATAGFTARTKGRIDDRRRRRRTIWSLASTATVLAVIVQLPVDAIVRDWKPASGSPTETLTQQAAQSIGDQGHQLTWAVVDSVTRKRAGHRTAPAIGKVQ